MLCLYLTIDNLESLSASNQTNIKTASLEAIEHSTDLCVLVSFSHPIATVDTHWNDIQSLLGNIYVVQLQVAYANQQPLMECNVLFESWCGYQMAFEPNLSRVLVSPQYASCIEEWNSSRANAGLGLFEIQILDTTAVTNTSTTIRSTPTITTVGNNSLNINKEPNAVSHHLSPNQQQRDHTVAVVKENKEEDKKQQQRQQEQVHPFSRVALGGTFDHIHAGHKILLTMAALLTNKSIVVGVTDDSMLQSKKHRQFIQPTEKRIGSVERYLHSVRRNVEPYVVPICDPFGPTITDPAIDALVCSKETLQGGEAVNRERQKRNMDPIELRVIDVISPNSTSIGSQDMSALKISSSWIRQYLATK
ncbi:hypothetical protein J3Q64DRAFT_1731636 [Phycomyces blakesleeanus]|uniref:Cytidyltransferase-like domain-containing protein n=2 Tax=Phycomyces blakesleeanus TaxID=4837 RepID=A0A163DZR9_PHYB8|nr:hypothetical protein PHYBLDRAFT_67624 [Phycomyces blakesleeanus NRRL 1555(-)]OAD74450.1 hypothetical protein PHYBLDRAFT_67624 [Phycomyces blakesleeanus NRRL 1555(-)]|eukprot:XP_018292490.1 hypothetical protein PHYBLDRAFT_67624 [Phycomyces blakesleeanus NRRL 1555(-)]